MFSTAVEVVLHIAFREAVSRRHAYLTLEHLLYALAHDPDGERILAACGADLPLLRRNLSDSLDESVEALPRGQEREPEQTAAFRRALQTAVLHVQSAQRQEAQVGDLLAAILQQPQTRAARCSPSRASRGSTCSSTSRTASRRRRFITTTAARPTRATAATGWPAAATPDPATARDPLSAYCIEPDRARAAGAARSAHRPHRGAAAHDRSALPPPQEQSRCSSATPASARRRWPKASPCGCSPTTCRTR